MTPTATGHTSVVAGGKKTRHNKHINTLMIQIHMHSIEMVII